MDLGVAKSSADKEWSERLGFSSNERVMPLSFDPMEFGLENDLKVALTELRWIRKTKGKLRNSDLRTVSAKYRFPIDFLKKGLVGFSYPDDYLISKSRWFPILYSWVVRNRRYSINLFKLQFAYLRTNFWSIFVLGILPAMFLYVDSFLQILFKLDLLQRISLVFLPLVLSFIALYFELRSYIGSKKTQLDECSTHLKEIGLHYIIAGNEKFSRDNFKYIIFVGNTVLKKLQSSPSLTFVYSRTGRILKQPTHFTQSSRFERVPMKLHLLPKPSVSVKMEDIPIFYAENPYVEYEKRIKELAVESRKDESEKLENEQR